MRKWLYLCLALIVTLSFIVGCSSPATPTPAPAAPKATAAPTAAPAAQVIHLKGQHLYPLAITPYGPFGERSGIGWMALEWSRWLTAASNGRLVIDWNEPASIFPVFDAFNATKQGVVDITASTGAYYQGTLKEADIDFGLPTAWDTIEAEFEGFYYYGIYDALKAIYAENNIVYLPFQSGTVVGIGTTFPAPNMASLKGKKIRAVGLWSDYVAMLGASPVAIPLGELYMAMKLGTIDGWMAGSQALEELKLKEVTKGFVYSPMVSRAPVNFLLNADKFKSLPQDLQNLILRDSKYVNMALAFGGDRLGMWSLAQAQKLYGTTLYAWPQSETSTINKQAVDVIWAKVAARSDKAANLVNLFKKQARDYGKID